MILQIHHAQITIPKGAEDEARKFYCALLGFKEISKPEALRGRGGFWMELYGFQIHIGTEDGVEREKSKAHLGYLVDNLVAWRNKLAQIGITVSDGTQIPDYQRFEFRDPFGNRVEFLQKEV